MDTSTRGSSLTVALVVAVLALLVTALLLVVGTRPLSRTGSVVLSIDAVDVDIPSCYSHRHDIDCAARHPHRVCALSSSSDAEYAQQRHRQRFCSSQDLQKQTDTMRFSTDLIF